MTELKSSTDVYEQRKAMNAIASADLFEMEDLFLSSLLLTKMWSFVFEIWMTGVAHEVRNLFR